MGGTGLCQGLKIQLSKGRCQRGFGLGYSPGGITARRMQRDRGKARNLKLTAIRQRNLVPLLEILTVEAQRCGAARQIPDAEGRRRGGAGVLRQSDGLRQILQLGERIRIDALPGLLAIFGQFGLARIKLCQTLAQLRATQLRLFCGLRMSSASTGSSRLDLAASTSARKRFRWAGW